MAERILLIEDDPRLAEMVSEYLGEAGFRVSIAAAGRAGLERLLREPFDALVLDLMLPDMGGLDVCRQLRVKSDIPVLMLTARGEAMDRVVGLEMGADDYLPKPFEPRELLARLRAILRRGRAGGPSNVLRFGRLEIDRDARVVRVEDAERNLTGYQFTLLVALAERAGRVAWRRRGASARARRALEGAGGRAHTRLRPAGARKAGRRAPPARPAASRRGGVALFASDPRLPARVGGHLPAAKVTGERGG